jgi:hypothetical protein
MAAPPCSGLGPTAKKCNGNAAVHLLKRRYALEGIKQYGSGVPARVALMNAPRQAKRLQRQQDHETREHKLNARFERDANRRDAAQQQIQRRAAREALKLRPPVSQAQQMALADQQARAARKRARAQAQAAQVAKELHRRAMQQRWR